MLPQADGSLVPISRHVANDEDSHADFPTALRGFYDIIADIRNGKLRLRRTSIYGST